MYPSIAQFDYTPTPKTYKDIPPLSPMALSLLEGLQECHRETYVSKAWEAFSFLVGEHQAFDFVELEALYKNLPEVIVFEHGILEGISHTYSHFEAYKPLCFCLEANLWDGSYLKSQLFLSPDSEFGSITMSIQDIFDYFLCALLFDELHSKERDSLIAIKEGRLKIQKHLFGIYGKDYEDMIDSAYGYGVAKQVIAFYDAI